MKSFMVRIHCEVMCRRRLEFGWTPEELAAKAGLDTRTVRRLEQSKKRHRLRSVIAIADALELELPTLILDDGPSEDGLSNDECRALAAFTASGSAIRMNLAGEDGWGLQEAMCVLSMVLTKTLGIERKALAEWEDGDEERVVAAFKAADHAIRTTLARGGKWGLKEATAVLSLLLIRYGSSFTWQSDDGDD